MEKEITVAISVALPIGIVSGALLIGILFQTIILSKLARLAERTKWKGDEIAIQSLRGFIIIVWFFIAGLHVALPYIPMPMYMLTILQKFLLVVLIFSITLVTAKIAAGFVQMYADRSKGAFPSTTIFMNITKAVIFVIGFLVILQTLGISITPIITALGVGGLAVALALQDTLSNLFAGIHIIAAGKMKPGDYVRLESGEEGFITDITWRNTTIKSFPNNFIIVPNSKLSSAIVTNFDLPEAEIGVSLKIGVSYGSDLEKVEKVTLDVAREVMSTVEGGVPGFEPAVRFHTFSDSSINFNVVLRARDYASQYFVIHEFIKRLHERYRQEGIVIPFPIRTIHMAQSAEADEN
ncbi:MAG: mechanosensitive ion channel family protein [Acidobacteriota bacterium]